MQVLSISGAVKGKGRPSNESTRKDKNRNSVSVGSFSEVPELSLPKLGYGLLTKKIMTATLLLHEEKTHQIGKKLETMYL